MAKRRTGLWIIGAHGAVATTVSVGLANLKRDPTMGRGLVSELAEFAELDFVSWDQIVVGGHEIRATDYATEIEILQDSSRVFTESLLNVAKDDLTEIGSRIRPGILYNCGSAIESLASDGFAHRKQTPRQLIDLIKADLAEFANGNSLDRVVVVNLSSTEPMVDATKIPATWSELEPMLERDSCPLSASSLYAIAAFEFQFPFVNFTPSLGSSFPALIDLAKQQKTCHMGRDGKTGETLMKSALAPMFAARNLEVMSWVGHNIFGNLDGKILDDPENKQTKVTSKDHLLKQILGYDPQTLVSIEYIRSLGDWKTAWDHIHFRGFLGTPMALQFTWQGSDSILAAPLVLDLFRFTELAAERKHIGLLIWLASFFKSPTGVSEHDFVRQFQMLQQWASTIV